jgi:MFS family permease
LKRHPLFSSLLSFKGNVRGCVYPEPLNAIPVNLYTPYVSVYMIALGVMDDQIGLIVSISWIVQLIMALLSGVITDKFGRRLTTLVSDLICWTVPAIISAIAQNFWFFLSAAIFTSFYRVPQNSWMCLMVEDSDPDQLVDIFSWIYIAGLLSAFFAPLAGLMIKSYSFIPTMRILYLFAALCFTVKAFITYKLTSETRQGIIRMQATKETSIFASLGGYKGVLSEILHTPKTLYTAGIMSVMSICMLINGTFWSILVTEKIKAPLESIAYFSFAKSGVMLLFFFAIIPHIQSKHFKVPLTLGFAGFVASQLILINTPVRNYALLLLAVVLEAGSIATINPLVDQLTVLMVDPQERARIQSILYVGIILITSPFGWIAGLLSATDKNLPFVLNIVLFMVGSVLAILAGRATSESGKFSPITEANV